MKCSVFTDTIIKGDILELLCAIGMNGQMGMKIDKDRKKSIERGSERK